MKKWHMQWTGKQMLLVGFLLVLYGFVIAFLMAIHVLKPSFLLAFTSYAGSLSGTILGVVGSILYVRERRKHDE